MKNRAFFVFDIFLLLFSIGCAFLSFVAIHQNIQVARVVSDSMAPAIHRGDTLIFKSVPTENISKGEILLLPLADGSGRSYVHRVFENVKNSDSSVTVVTKGDANPLPDNWKLKITSDTVPIYLATIPTKDIPMLDLNKWLLLAIFTGLLFLVLPLLFPRRKPHLKSDEISHDQT